MYCNSNLHVQTDKVQENKHLNVYFGCFLSIDLKEDMLQMIYRAKSNNKPQKGVFLYRKTKAGRSRRRDDPDISLSGQRNKHNRAEITTSTEMERMTFPCLLLTALVSVSAGRLHQYHFVNERKSWTDAQRYCRDKHIDLVTINDTQDLTDIELVIPRGNPAANADLVWIGLRSTDTWIWSLNDPNFYTANQSEYRNWAPIHLTASTDKQQPDGDGDCVFMNKEGKWYDDMCNQKHHFICYNASQGFILINEEKNWTEAQRYCRHNHTDLASVRNSTENDNIKSKVSSDKNWIGLHRLWVWSDNSSSTFTHWKEGDTNIRENRCDVCSSIDINHPQKRWTDDRCSNPHPFVCYDDKLVLIRENRTWSDALKRCRSRDMDLVSVVSEEIQHRLEKVTASASTPHVWLGLRHSCVVGLWFWVNGQIVCYEQWAEGHGTGEEDCSTMRSGAVRTADQRWISLPETDTNNFICVRDE